MTEDELCLHPIHLNDDDAVPGRFVVVWQDIEVGRILKRPGGAAAKPSWSWAVILPGKTQPATHRGVCSDIDECMRRFKVVWSGIIRALTKGEITIMRRQAADQQRRARWLGTKYPNSN